MHLNNTTPYCGEISLAGAPEAGVFPNFCQLSSDATGGDLTLTTAQVLGGMFHRDPAGGARTDTTPTAAAIIAAMGSPTVGQSFMLIYKNTADANETITVAGGTGVTVVGTATIAQNNTKIFVGVVTGAATISLYSVGTLTH